MHFLFSSHFVSSSSSSSVASPEPSSPSSLSSPEASASSAPEASSPSPSPDSSACLRLRLFALGSADAGVSPSSQHPNNVCSHTPVGQPAKAGPSAIVYPSRQQPYLVSSQVLYSIQPCLNGPSAA